MSEAKKSKQQVSKYKVFITTLLLFVFFIVPGLTSTGFCYAETDWLSESEIKKRFVELQSNKIDEYEFHDDCCRVGSKYPKMGYITKYLSAFLFEYRVMISSELPKHGETDYYSEHTVNACVTKSWFITGGEGQLNK